jgi:hypothetical protein
MGMDTMTKLMYEKSLKKWLTDMIRRAPPGLKNGSGKVFTIKDESKTSDKTRTDGRPLNCIRTHMRGMGPASYGDSAVKGQ